MGPAPPGIAVSIAGRPRMQVTRGDPFATNG